MPIEITMPRLSDTMEMGTIIKWDVAEGQAVSAGEVVADVETDKATMEMQVYDDGTIAAITVAEGETVDVGTVIAVLAEEDEDVEAVAAAARTGAPAASRAEAGSEAPPEPEPETTTAVAEPPPAPAPAATTSNDNGRKLRVTPVARRLAEEHGIAISTIQGSGPHGRVIKRDVLEAIATGVETAAAVPPSATAITRAEPLAAPISSAPEGLTSQRLELTQMRQTIARRLVESKTTIPHYQVTMTFDMDNLLALRATLNEQLAPQGVKLSVNDFLVRACALAMRAHPEFNASWGGDHIAIHGDVNIGVAISLPADSGGGLVVATLRDADRRSLREISAETKALAEKARTRGLTIEEMSDSTFTISNLGMFGVDNFTAIINPPNVAILAVGGAIEKPVVRNGELVVGHEMSSTLSLDHRVIDGAMAAQYLATLKQYIENPATVLI